MTDNQSGDPEHERQTTLSRRQALAGIGAAGLLSLGATAGTVAESDPLTERTAQWTARRRERAASTVAELAVDRVASELDQQLRDLTIDTDAFRDLTDDALSETVGNTVEDDEIPLHTVDSVSQLQYLGAQWDEHSNPSPETGDDGAWQHTFVLSTFGAAQQLDPAGTWFDDDGDLIYGADRLQFRPHHRLTVQPGLRVTATADSEYDAIRAPFDGQEHTVDEEPPDRTAGDDEGQAHVGVSARRDRNLFGFAGPAWLSQTVGDEVSLDALLDQVASAPDDGDADYGLVRESVYAAADLRQNLSTVGRSISGLLGIGAGLGEGGVIDKKWENLGIVQDGEVTAGEVVRETTFPNRANRLLNAAQVFHDVGEAYAEINDEVVYDKTKRRFYHGFEQWQPGAGPVGLGFVMFDVYVAPGKTGRVDVSAANRFLIGPEPSDYEDSLDEFPITSQTWRLEFDALPPKPEAGEPSTSELFNAEVVDYDFTVHEASGSRSDDYPFDYLSRHERPTAPGPSITPYFEGASGATKDAAVGDAPTFSAHDTTLSRSPIVRYDWSIHQLYEDASGELVAREAYDDQSGADATFSPTIEAPGEDDAGVQRVELTVHDEFTSASTTFDFSVGAPSAPEPTIHRQPDEPVVYEPVSFEVDADMPGDDASYSWTLTDRPAELEHAPRDLYTGTGETFSFEPPVAGSYSVTVSIEDDLGAEAVATETISVADGFAVSIDGPSDAAQGESVTYEASVRGDAEDLAVEWTAFGETHSGSSVSGSFETAGQHTVAVTATAADGTTDSSAIDVTVDERMTVSLSGPSELDVGETGTVEATVAGAEADVNYAFSNADPVDSSQRTSPTRPVTFEEPGEHEVSVTATEQGDDHETASDAIAIDVGSFDLSIDGPTAPEADASVTYEASVDGDVAVDAFEWDAFGETHSGSSVSGSFDDAGERTVALTATTVGGATASTTLDVSVQSADEPLTVSLDAPSELAVGQTGTVEASVSSADGDVSYAFTNADADASGATRDVTFAEPGEHEVSVAVTDDHETATTTATIDVLEFELTVDGPSSVYVGDEVVLEASVASDVAVDAFEWDAFGESYAGSTVSATLSETGQRTASVTATSGEAVATASHDVAVAPEPDGATEGPPTDLDGDGLYEDVSGDGDARQDDVVTFFEHQHREDWKAAELFDYSGNGEVNQFDAVELFDVVVRS